MTEAGLTVKTRKYLSESAGKIDSEFAIADSRAFANQTIVFDSDDA